MGGQTCTVCRNEARETVDQALVAGEPLRNIAERTGLSTTALHRHKTDHLPATLVKAVEAQDEAHGSRLLEQVQGLVGEALASIERSKEKDEVNERDVLAGVREARSSLELTGRITGELRENRDAAPETALDAIIKLANALSVAELRGWAGQLPDPAVVVEGDGHVVEPV